MALFKINKGLATNLAKNMPYAKEGFAYFTKDDGKFYIDIDGDGTTTKAEINVNRIPLNAAKADIATMIQATAMATDDSKVYPILAFNITDSTKNLVEAKYSQIGIKNGTLVIPSVEDKDEILISNEGLGRGIVIDNKGTNNAIEILNGKGIKVAQDPTENLELTTKQYVDNKLANKSNTGHNHDATYKKIQTAVPSPKASNTDISFIDTVSQDTQGKITATKKTVRDASASQSGVVSTGTQTFAGEKTLNNKTHFSKGFDLKTDNGNAQFNANTVSVSSGTDYVDLYASTVGGGNGNKARPLVLNANANGSGNVGIGITQPTEKLEVDGNVKAIQFKGNADTADKWKTARKLTIGSTGKDVDGSADVNWSLDEIGVAAKKHTHTKSDITDFAHAHDDRYYTENEINDKLKAINDKIGALLGANDALVFKGIIDGKHPLPTANYEVGHTYRVNEAGTYAGQKCEQGDLIICIADALSTSTPHWTVAQTNIDGAVIGPANATGDNIVLFNGATGKSIKDSGKKLSDFAPSKHDHIITATAKNDGVVVLTGTSGTNAVTYEATHAKKGPSTTTNTIKGPAKDVSISGAGKSGSIVIPKVTVDAYGHTTGLTEQTLTITLPNDTHHQSSTVITDNTAGITNAASENDNTYLNHIENGVVRSAHKIVGAGSTTVSSDVDGVLTITSENTVYSHPTTPGNIHLPAGGKVGDVLLCAGDNTGAGKWGIDPNIKTAIDNLNVDEAGGEGKYIQAIKQVNGKIVATAETIDTTLSASSTKPVQNKAVNDALSKKVNTTTFNSHTGNMTMHITDGERIKWNAAYTHSQSAHAPANAEKNQNAFSNIQLNTDTTNIIKADSATDTLTLVAGSNVTLTPDVNNDKITIAATNTDTKVTAVGNHYTPVEDSKATLSADASSTTAATWNTTSLVTGVNLQRDAKGHVTGVTVDSIKMPANPNINAVTGPNSSTVNAVPTFADATGKVIKNNSTVTIDNTGLFTAPYIATGTDKTHYFQSRKFRGEGNADTYYHAIDFGYSGHNQVDFHEYGGIWNFYKNTKGTAADGKLVASIKPDGFHGNLNGNATSADKVNNNLVIKLNSGTTEGTNQFTYNGSATKNINITPANIGAASSSHNHDSSYVKKSGDTMTGDLTLNKKLIANNLIVLKNGQTYGTSAPTSGTTGQLFFAQDTSDSDYLPLTGGTLSGNLTLNEKLLITNKMYGTTKPNNPVEGQIFFQENDGSLTLPAGGTAGQYLVKNSSNDSDASWKSLPALNYLPLSGGTLTGNLTISHSDTNDATVRVTNSKGSIGLLSSTNRGLYDYTKSKWLIYTDGTKASTSYALYGAVWNDYAEFREGDTIDAGRCVVEVGDDTLITSTERLMPGANITSDTFGFAIGETEQAKTPIAVSGRVLAYPYESREEFKKNVGRPVCSGPNGTVSIMTDEEYRNKGYCAIGTISAVPDYEEWGTGKVKVNGRVWIKV